MDIHRKKNYRVEADNWKAAVASWIGLETSRPYEDVAHLLPIPDFFVNPQTPID